jgi:transposase-like protein
MLITARLHATSEPLHPNRPKCPRCGSAPVVAEESRLNPSGRIDHDWLCDDCGNTFSTSIKLGQDSVSHKGDTYVEKSS